MINFLIILSSIVVGYLLGSISFSRLITSLVSPGTDLKETLVPVEGSDHTLNMNAISATSVRFTLGPKYGILVTILDMVKVAVPVATFRYFFPDLPVSFFAAAGGIIGHNWPVYYKFNGGYGQSAIYGALLVIEWTAVPINILGTGILYLIFKQVHIASFGGVLLLIPWLWFRGFDVYGLMYAIICSIAYFIRTLPDYLEVRRIENQNLNPPKSNNEGD